MPQAVALTSGPELMGAIAGAVIGHDALGLDAEGAEVGQGAFQEEDGALLAFIRHDLSESDPRGVINADVDELPPGTTDLVAPVMGDAVTGAHDAAELLEVRSGVARRGLTPITHDWGSGL